MEEDKTPQKKPIQGIVLRSYGQLRVGDFLYVPDPRNYLSKSPAEPVIARINNVTEYSFSYTNMNKTNSTSFFTTIEGKIPPNLLVFRKGECGLEVLAEKELAIELITAHANKMIEDIKKIE